MSVDNDNITGGFLPQILLRGFFLKTLSQIKYSSLRVIHNKTNMAPFSTVPTTGRKKLLNKLRVCSITVMEPVIYLVKHIDSVFIEEACVENKLAWELRVKE